MKIGGARQRQQSIDSLALDRGFESLPTYHWIRVDVLVVVGCAKAQQCISADIDHHARSAITIQQHVPYDSDVASALQALVPWLAEDAVVAVERSTRGPELEWPPGLQAERSRRYGEATLWYALRR